ncbi:zincin [Backusella circina FSU 941]|nr:zincin [Backusella circina FSU 941]
MFFILILLLIVLFILVGMFAGGLRIGDGPSIISPHPKFPQDGTGQQNYCDEPQCVVTAAQIIQDLDQSVNPCDDFYTYICSKWEENHKTITNRTRVDSRIILGNSIKHRLNEILNADKDMDLDIEETKTTLPNPQDIIEKQLFTKLSYFYQSCMNYDSDTTELFDIFHEIQLLVPSPLYSGKERIHPPFAVGLTSALTRLAGHNIWPLFEMKVVPNWKQNEGRSTISIVNGQLTLPNATSYEDFHIMNTYLVVIADTLKLLIEKDTSNIFHWGSLSPIALAHRILDFEKKIAKTSSNQSEVEQWTLEELEQISPSIHWKQFMESMLPDQVVLPPSVSVPSQSFLQFLSNEIVKKTDMQTLQIYLMWRALWQYIDVLGYEFSGPKRRLEEELYNQVQILPIERWEACIDLIDKSPMGLLLGHYFVLDTTNSISAKKKVEEMSYQMLDTLKQKIPHLSWIKDTETQNQILKKLNGIEFQVSYSTVNPDIGSSASLAEYFRDINVEKNDFFGNMLRANKHGLKRAWTNLGKSMDKSTWNVNPQSVNPYFYKEKLFFFLITIPGGILQPPFYDTAEPEYLVYSTIGWMIGHEILHGFDKIGRQYDSDGALGHWWSNATEHSLDSQNQCFISQYDRLGADGEATLNNNYADNGGLALSLASWKLRDQTVNNEDLPGLEFTKDQLFFIQYSRMKCGTGSTRHSDFAPDRLRVNGPLMNSKYFATTFGCKTGTYMNPANKCQVW